VTALALILVLWLVGSLVQIHAGLVAISPLLANLVVGLIIALIVILAGTLIYYATLFLRPKRPLTLPKAPDNRAEAAAETLRVLEQQVQQIQDEVAQQALRTRSQEIADEMARGALRVVVFGTGSSGKTSIVNAILGRIAGNVGATLGTTTVEQRYRLHLKGVDREIWITDTPGILEVGVAGTQRAATARQLAAESSLVVFVVDGDLRQSEYEALRSLTQMGKRALVVFNKIDRYTSSEQETILQHLQKRLRPTIAAEDIVAIAANPMAVTLEDGSVFQPQPDILPLLRRMAAVLRSEGEDLIADNILLQSQRLSDETRRVLDDQRRRHAEKIVDRFQWIGAGVVSLTPLPVVDLLATAAVNAQMVVEIGRVYGCEINLDRGKELAVSLAKTLVSLGVVRGAIELLSIALQTNVSTFLIGRAIQGATAAYLTRIAGRSFIEYFRRDQTWGDGGMTEVVQAQFQLNRRDEFMQAFVKDAIARVIQPLTQDRPAPPKQ
ncbi:MAG TPA: GTP-binding protein, partial [Chroococcidiopsis sp.]